MAKRRASAVVDGFPAGPAAVASDGAVDQQEEQRRFLLAAAGAFDILSTPSVHKQKEKKKTTKKVVSVLPRVDSGAESSGPDNQAPRNVDARETSKVEKDSTFESVDSEDTRDDNHQDNAQNAAQRSNDAAKSIHNKRKAGKTISSSTAVTASAEVDDTENTLSHKRTPKIGRAHV